jgi:hypothetical protein
MKYKAMFVALACFLLALSAPAVLAQEETEAGVTPDSPLWGVDVALDNLAYLLAAGPESKAERGLEIAEERLQEIKIMADEKKIEAMAKAEDEHEKVVVKIEKEIDDVDDDDPTEKVKKVIKLETKVKEHEANFNAIKQNIDIRIKGELTEEQQALIDSILSSLEGQTADLKIKIENKKDKTKIEIKIKTGKSEIEIEQEIEEIEREIAGMEEELEVKARTFNNQTQIRLELEFESATLDADSLIDEIIEKFALDEESADALLDLEEEEEALDEDRFRIRAEIEEDISEVEVERRVTIDSTERADIIDAIVENSQLTESEIRAAWELKIEGEEEEKEEDEDEIECVTDEDCEEGKFCIEGDCEDLEDEIECTTDEDCEEGRTCIDGDCEDLEDDDEIECTTDEDCEEGKTCIEGDCESQD